MNIKKAAATILSFLVIILAMKSFAMTTGFVTEEMSADEQKMVLSNCSIALLNEPGDIYSIHCFDVNEKGLIALAFDMYPTKVIHIFDSDGKFQYGYSFDNSGTFGMEWDHDDLLIYFVRSHIAALVDRYAEIRELRSISTHSHDNNNYWLYTVYATKRVAGKTVYEIENDPGIYSAFASSYTRLVKTEQDGKKTILYTDSMHNPRIIFVLSGTSLSFAMVIWGLVRYTVKKLKA